MKKLLSFLLKFVGMVAAAALLLKLGEMLSRRLSKNQHSVRIIDGFSDGPTAIYVSSQISPEAIAGFFGKISDSVKELIGKISV